jgi:hypothetical protein
MKTGPLEQELSDNLALYEDDDADRTRFALHNMIANVMQIADREGVDLVDLIAEGVDLYEQRGSPNSLPHGDPKEFFAACSKAGRDDEEETKS